MLNFFAGGSAAIDEDEGLFFPDSGVSDGASLPATGFDEPSCRHLDAVLNGIARSIGMRLFDFGIFFLADHGIHEEGTGTADDARLGEFFATDVNDDAPQVGCGERLVFRLSFFDGAPRGFVVQIGTKDGGETIGDVGDDELAAILGLFEDAVAVTVVTIFSGKDLHRSRGDFHRLDFFDEVSHFCAVGADVLHGTRSDFAGNEGEVFCAKAGVVHRPFHEIIPNHPCAGFDPNAFALASQNFNAANAGVKHGAVIVSKKKEIAAAADVQPRRGGQTREHLPDQCLRVGIFNERLATDVQAEGVVRKEGVTHILRLFFWGCWEYNKE